MKGMPSGLAGKVLPGVEAAAEDLWKAFVHAAPTSTSTSSTTTTSAGAAKKEAFEPRSVLDHGGSPSPPTSASTLSSSLGGGGGGGGGGDAAALAREAWEGVVAAAASPGSDQSLLRWMMGEISMDFEAGGGDGGLGLVDLAFACGVSSGMESGAPGSMAAPSPPASPAPVASAGELLVMEGNNGNRVLPFPPSLHGMTMEEKQEDILLLPQNSAFHQQQEDLLPPPPKRHHSMADHRCQVPKIVPFCDTGQDPLPWQHQQQQQCLESFPALPHRPQQLPMKPKAGGDEAAAAAAQHQQLLQQQQEALVEQLFKAAQLVETGNFADARVVLARLNHQLSPTGKPLVRSAFYCKEALQSIITTNSYSTAPSTLPPLQRNPPSTVLSTPVDVVLKLSAYKAFSEISPILQFTNFTCTQALLEGLNDCNRIHIIDFDVGVGGHWSSFMLELAQRRCGDAAAAPSLKITAIASVSSQNFFELGLTGQNLTHFAGGLNMRFEFNILNHDPLDLASLLDMIQSDEAIAVNLPVSAAYPSITSILWIVKQLSPKIVVSVDHGWDHTGRMFSHHFIHMLQSATILLDSIDATGISPVVASKIEQYLLQPRIENAVVEHHNAAIKGLPVLPWWVLFASAGFTAMPFSNFTESQAECLLKRTQVKGFLLEKHQASLLLCWHNGVLVSVSAWKC